MLCFFFFFFFTRLLEYIYSTFGRKIPSAGKLQYKYKRHILLHAAQTLGFHRHQLMSCFVFLCFFFFFLNKKLLSNNLWSYDLIISYCVSLLYYTVRRYSEGLNICFPSSFVNMYCIKYKLLKKKQYEPISFV